MYLLYTYIQYSNINSRGGVPTVTTSISAEFWSPNYSEKSVLHFAYFGRVKIEGICLNLHNYFFL